MLKFFRLQEGWLTVGLLALLLFSVTLSIQQAQWVDGLSILTPITLVGLSSGIILAKVRGVPRSLLDLVGLMLGAVTILVAVSSVMTDSKYTTIQEKVQDLALRTASWVGIAVRQDWSDDVLVFILSLAIVAWVLSYSAAYFVFKSRQLWWALVPSGVALLINLSYSPVPLNGFIIIFMFSALLLMIRFNLMLQEERWQRERVNYSPSLTWAFLWAGSAVSVVLAFAMWYVPTTQVNATLNDAWGKVSKPWDEFQVTMSRLFPTIPSNQSFGGYSSFNDKFTLGGGLNLSDSTALVVKSRQRLYWRAKTYDDYNGLGWTNTAASTFTILPNASSKLALEATNRLGSRDIARKEVTYTVEIMHPKEDILFAASRPVQLTTNSRLNVSWRSIHDTYDIASTSPVSVPLELVSLLGSLKNAQKELQNISGSSGIVDAPTGLFKATKEGDAISKQVDDLEKRGLTVTFNAGRGSVDQLSMSVSGEVPVYDDLTSVNAPDSVPPDFKYTVTSLISEADADQLRAAGTDYEDWVTKRYTSLPANVTQRVRDLAEQIVSDAHALTPYDKAKAIETYLRANFKYSTKITMPPQGAERADWFLFETKEGYCEYYATAMIVMLRHMGIPSRMATGYAPGAFDGRDTFTVTEASAHTWPEVYFPGYGWIEFEPTPSQTEVNRPYVAEQPTVGPEGSLAVSPTPFGYRGANENNLDDKSIREPLKGTGDTSGSAQFPNVAITVILLVLAILLVLRWLGLLRGPGARNLESAGHYYGRMVRWARLLGIGPASYQTPYEFSEAVAREVPGTGLFTRSITRAYVQERFSRSGVEVSEKIAIRRAWDSLRARFWRALPVRQLKRTGRKK